MLSYGVPKAEVPDTDDCDSLERNFAFNRRNSQETSPTPRSPWHLKSKTCWNVQILQIQDNSKHHILQQTDADAANAKEYSALACGIS